MGKTFLGEEEEEASRAQTCDGIIPFRAIVWGSSSSSGSLDRIFVAFPPGVYYQNLGTSFKLTYGKGCCKHLGRKTDPWWSCFPMTTRHTAHYLSLSYLLIDTIQYQKKAALIHKGSTGILLKNQLFYFLLPCYMPPRNSGGNTPKEWAV